MTATATTTKQKPASPSASPFKYVIQGRTADDEERTLVFADRPTQNFVKALGQGEWTLYRADGQSLRRFVVDFNRNQNVRITGTVEEGLPAMSALNIKRLATLYMRVVKIWPAKVKDAKSIQTELARRETLNADAEDTYLEAGVS